MSNFYIKNEDGEFVEADKQVDELFRQKSDKIVATKLSAEREKVQQKIRDEIEGKVREESTESIRKELDKELSAKYRAEVKAADKRAEELGTQLRRKTIAAEYGFKTEAEQFLGEGSEEDMRAKADALKNSFANTGFKAPSKETKDASSDPNLFVELCN